MKFLPAAVSAMTIAGISYGLIGIVKSQFLAAMRDGYDTFVKGKSNPSPSMLEPDGDAIDRLTEDPKSIK